MGDKNRKRKNLEHQQRDNRVIRQAVKAEHHRVTFEINRAGIKARVETDRQHAMFAVLVFLIGLASVSLGLAYVIMAILYG